MVHQCAWCLRLIDQMGNRVSQQPFPKLYEASHGMCRICGGIVFEDVMRTTSPPESRTYAELILEMQHSVRPAKQPKARSKLRLP
jgi:hypothetical protein